jgi:hypothetical protein
VAAAVANRFVPFAIGVDTAGDLRVPASLCGVVAYRPTHGRYPRTGVLSLSATLDTVGVVARNVEDVQLVDAVVCAALNSGAGAGEAASPPGGGAAAADAPASGAGEGGDEAELEAAAVKLQAIGRGFLERKRLGHGGAAPAPAKSSPAASPAPAPAPAPAAVAAAAVGGDADEVHAATRIQALARGRRDRR